MNFDKGVEFLAQYTKDINKAFGDEKFLEELTNAVVEQNYFKIAKILSSGLYNNLKLDLEKLNDVCKSFKIPTLTKEEYYQKDLMSIEEYIPKEELENDPHLKKYCESVEKTQSMDIKKVALSLINGEQELTKELFFDISSYLAINNDSLSKSVAFQLRDTLQEKAASLEFKEEDLIHFQEIVNKRTTKLYHEALIENSTILDNKAPNEKKALVTTIPNQEKQKPIDHTNTQDIGR